MTVDTTQFAAWVEPLARQYRESREEAVRFATTLRTADMGKQTGDIGWTVREELAHIAASDDDFLRTLDAVLRGETVDLSIFSDIDSRNARNLTAWEGRSVKQIAAALEANGLKLQEILARLTDADETRQPEGMPFPLSGMVQGYGQHEPYHLGQIRAAIG